MQAPGMCMQTWHTVADRCKEKRKAYLLMWMLDGNVDTWVCRCVGVQMRMAVDVDVSTDKKYLLDHADGCVHGRAEGWCACMRTQMRVKERKKEHTDLRWTQCRMRCMQMTQCNGGDC